MKRNDKRYYRENAQCFCPYWKIECNDNASCMTCECEYYFHIPCYFYQEREIVKTANVLDRYLKTDKPFTVYYCIHDNIKAEEKVCLNCRKRKRGSNFTPIYKMYKPDKTKEKSDEEDSRRKLEILTKKQRQVKKFVLPEDQAQLQDFLIYLKKYDLSFTYYESNHNFISIVYYDQYKIEL